MVAVNLPGVLSGCGSAATTQLSTTVEAATKGAVKPGDTPTYKVVVTNNGPGLATGVNLHVDLPAEFLYKTTISIAGEAARTQPVDPDVHSPRPEWGVWSIAAPRINEDGTRHTSDMVLTFVADVNGKPGNYNLKARATGDNAEDEAAAPPLAVELSSAPDVAMTVSVSPGNVHPNLEVTYTVAIQNKGTAASSGVAVLVTLPPVLGYSATTNISGNFSRTQAIDPIKNTGVAFFSGFSIPPASDSGPGTLNIIFRARCAKTAAFGSFPVSAQVTDSAGTVLSVRDTSPVQVIP
ncbi:MAG: hypothetical protein ABR564_01975 [Candidatus Dormibacteria bacterium]